MNKRTRLIFLGLSLIVLISVGRYVTNDFKFLLNLSSQKYNVRDLWEDINVGNTKKIFQKELAPHDVIAIKLTKVKK